MDEVGVWTLEGGVVLTSRALYRDLLILRCLRLWSEKVRSAQCARGHHPQRLNGRALCATQDDSDVIPTFLLTPFKLIM